MDQYLKELIEKATINGDLSEENKMFILQKANELWISEIEVNIYIEIITTNSLDGDYLFIWSWYINFWNFPLD